MNMRPSYRFDASIIVISFNTRELLRECIESTLAECARLPEGISAEVLVVDNASRDGSAEMVESEFAATATPVRLFRSEVNLGFGAANNVAMEAAEGRYLVLLNSDAFFHVGALPLAMEHMDASPDVGVGGARQVSRDGGWQPSALRFPSILRDAMMLTGLSSRYPKSKTFGAAQRTWADPNQPADVDWVPGSFAILRREALARAGLFDPAFFFYSEEVDLCRRIKAQGYRVFYWPNIVVTHIGGESGRKAKSLLFSEKGAQIVVWRMRSTLLYYRKHHGAQAWLARGLEEGYYSLRWLRNRLSWDPARRESAREFALLVKLMRQAWAETDGGRVSPPRPW